MTDGETKRVDALTTSMPSPRRCPHHVDAPKHHVPILQDLLRAQPALRGTAVVLVHLLQRPRMLREPDFLPQLLRPRRIHLRPAFEQTTSRKKREDRNASRPTRAQHVAQTITGARPWGTPTDHKTSNLSHPTIAHETTVRPSNETTNAAHTQATTAANTLEERSTKSLGLMTY